MPYCSKKQIEQARNVDLLSYLQRYEPHELVHVSAGVYCTKTHDSLKISNGKWFWWSKGIGGHNALDYLVLVKNLSLPEAVGLIISEVSPTSITPSVQPSVKYHPPQSQPFKLPTPYVNNNRVFAYLRSRGIDTRLINHCIKHGLLYEDSQRHNAVFVGYDPEQKPRYAYLRSTLSQSTFMREVLGSEKQYSFCFPAKDSDAEIVCVFESAIDALSYATIRLSCHLDFNDRHLLSLGGVSQYRADNHKLPIALDRFLQEHKGIRQINLCLDTDAAGLEACRAIEQAATDKLVVRELPKNVWKDYNEMLCAIQEISPPQTRKIKGGEAR